MASRTFPSLLTISPSIARMRSATAHRKLTIKLRFSLVVLEARAGPDSSQGRRRSRFACFAPVRDLLPAVVLPISKGEHLAIFASVPIGVHQRVPIKRGPLPNLSNLLRSSAIAVTVPTRQPAIAFLELGADAMQALGFAPGTQVDVERARHYDNLITLLLVPLDPLKSASSDGAWKNVRRVPPPTFTHGDRRSPAEAESRDNKPRPARGHEAETISEYQRADHHTPCHHPAWFDGETNKRRERVACRDRTVEVEQR